ncbi:MAG: M23 family metallopeptidase [Spirochaetota bacterium]
MKVILIHMLLFMVCSRVYPEIISVINLNHTDPNFYALYTSTTSSRNRMIADDTKLRYQQPVIYEYQLKPGEDIWTIIAKTSLNIDTIATLNRIDFIGMIKGKKIFLPDTLGIFFDSDKNQKQELSEEYSIKEENILEVSDPLNEGNKLYFLPERKLSFLERSYLRGVVFHAPLTGIKTSGFGLREDPFVNETAFHGGIDIATTRGKAARASRRGNVVYADKADGYGNTVIIKHQIGYYTLYGHLDEIYVEKPQHVETGEIIGTVGSTGRTTGPHLHFEIRRYNEKLNPDNIPFFLAHN